MVVTLLPRRARQQKRGDVPFSSRSLGSRRSPLRNPRRAVLQRAPIVSFKSGKVSLLRRVAPTLGRNTALRLALSKRRGPTVPEPTPAEKPINSGGCMGPVASFNSQDPDWTLPLNDVPRRSFVSLIRGAFPRHLREKWFALLEKNIPWYKPKVGQRFLPRSAAWLTAQECNCKYRYGGTKWPGLRMEPWFEEITAKVCKICGIRDVPNSCNANYYENGSESVGWHADDENLFEANIDDSLIISLSLGVPRRFEVRPKDDPNTLTVLLRDGDLCTMEGYMQKHYDHRVPKQPDCCGARINLTWRFIRAHEAGCPANTFSRWRAPELRYPPFCRTDDDVKRFNLQISNGTFGDSHERSTAKAVQSSTLSERGRENDSCYVGSVELKKRADRSKRFNSNAKEPCGPRRKKACLEPRRDDELPTEQTTNRRENSDDTRRRKVAANIVSKLKLQPVDNKLPQSKIERGGDDEVEPRLRPGVPPDHLNLESERRSRTRLDTRGRLQQRSRIKLEDGRQDMPHNPRMRAAIVVEDDRRKLPRLRADEEHRQRNPQNRKYRTRSAEGNGRFLTRRDSSVRDRIEYRREGIMRDAENEKTRRIPADRRPPSDTEEDTEYEYEYLTPAESDSEEIERPVRESRQVLPVSARRPQDPDRAKMREAALGLRKRDISRRSPLRVFSSASRSAGVLAKDRPPLRMRRANAGTAIRRFSPAHRSAPSPVFQRIEFDSEDDRCISDRRRRR